MVIPIWRFFLWCSFQEWIFETVLGKLLPSITLSLYRNFVFQIGLSPLTLVLELQTKFHSKDCKPFRGAHATRPVHAKLSHSALSSRAHLGAGWELNFQLFGSSSSSVSMAPMEPNFQLWLRLRGSGSLRAVSLHKST